MRSPVKVMAAVTPTMVAPHIFFMQCRIGVVSSGVLEWGEGKTVRVMCGGEVSVLFSGR